MRLLLTVSFLAMFCGMFNAHAQIPDRVIRVGLIRPGELTPDREHYLTLFCDDLRSGGWVEERNLALEYRSVSGRAELLPEVALALASTQPDAAVALRGAASTQAAQRATIAFLDTPSVG